MSYFFDHAWQTERERLRRLEDFFDPHTHEDIERLGIRPGWRCLEVGAGGGSIAEWLAWRVGPTGRVVATDLQTRFLERIVAPNFECRRHRIGKDTLEEDAFDLVHARAVLEHLPHRREALEQMVSALRPGGWLFLEAADFSSVAPMSPEDDALFTKVWNALQKVLEDRGFHTTWGRRVAWEMDRLGLLDVGFRGRIFEWGGQGGLTPFYTQTLERLGSALTDDGDVGADEIQDFLAMVNRPDFRAMGQITCSVWGRKPD